jgi:phospholipid transport system transporter-binding protein
VSEVRFPVIDRQGERCLVRGPVTHAGAEALLASGERHFGGGRLVFDFSGAESADSSALSLMLEWIRRAAARDTEIAFSGLGPALASLIELYGLAELIPLAAE